MSWKKNKVKHFVKSIIQKKKQTVVVLAWTHLNASTTVGQRQTIFYEFPVTEIGQKQKKYVCYQWKGSSNGNNKNNKFLLCLSDFDYDFVKKNFFLTFHACAPFWGNGEGPPVLHPLSGVKWKIIKITTSFSNFYYYYYKGGEVDLLTRERKSWTKIILLPFYKNLPCKWRRHFFF